MVLEVPFNLVFCDFVKQAWKLGVQFTAHWYQWKMLHLHWALLGFGKSFQASEENVEIITDNLSDSNQHLHPLTVMLHSLVKIILLKSLIMGPKHCDAATYSKKPPPKSSRSLHRISGLPWLSSKVREKNPSNSLVLSSASLCSPLHLLPSPQQTAEHNPDIALSKHAPRETAELLTKPDLPKMPFFTEHLSWW